MTEYPNHPVYVLDANVFVEAKNKYYAFDIAPFFWDSLATYAEKGVIKSIDRVLTELKRGHDELKDWAESDFI